MDKTFLGFIVVLLLILGVVWVISGKDEDPVAGTLEVKEYKSDELGISFSYPSHYAVTERDLSTPQRQMHALVLMPADAVIPVDSEPPPLISVELYQNNLDQSGARAWIENNAASNFKLSDGVLATTTVGTRVAFKYQSTGLYETDNIVMTTSRWVVALRANWITATDPTRLDVQTILTSLEFAESNITDPQAL